MVEMRVGLTFQRKGRSRRQSLKGKMHRWVRNVDNCFLEQKRGKLKKKIQDDVILII